MWLHFRSICERGAGHCELQINDSPQIGNSLEACVQRGDQSFSGHETSDGELFNPEVD